MAELSTAQPDATGKLASLVAAAQAKSVHLSSTEPHQQPGATGGLESLFASAHGRRVHLGAPEPEQQINHAKGKQRSGTVASGVSNGKPLNAATSDRSPGVASGYYIVILRWPVGSRMIHQNTTVIRRVTTVRTERGVRLTVCQGDVS